jgi:hypothetical protein
MNLVQEINAISFNKMYGIVVRKKNYSNARKRDKKPACVSRTLLLPYIESIKGVLCRRT